MWLSESSSARIPLRPVARLTMFVTVAITLVLGVLPTFVLRLSDTLIFFIR